MILDGVCYSVIHFWRVMLSRMIQPSCSQSFMLVSTCLYLRVISSPGVYIIDASVSPLHAPLLIISPFYHLSKTLSPPLWQGYINMLVKLAHYCITITTTMNNSTTSLLSSFVFHMKPYTPIMMENEGTRAAG